MTTTEEFISKFHDLEGVLLKEKKKSFHQLLKPLETSPEIVDQIIVNLKPTTYLEETFKIELLIYFKRSDNLIEILKNGEEIGACKIIRQSWFVQDLMKNSTTRFVQEIFPCLSFSVRTKILKKILVFMRDEIKIDELFEKISLMYGSNVGLVLLPGCSIEKIKDYLRNNRADLSVTQMKALFDKDKSIIMTYFDLLKGDDKPIDNYRWYSLFQYIGVKDPLFYLEITDKFKLYKRGLGRRSTKKVVNSQRQKILEKPEDFRCLKDDALVRKLGTDFPTYYKNALPKKLSNFPHCYAKTMLKYYVKNKQYALFFNTFQELYDKNLWDNSEYMDERLIEFIQDKEERDKWISKFENRAKIVQYRKRKMCMMSARCMEFEDDEDMGFGENAIKERKTIFNTLISTCKLTKDYDAFLNILKSFCERHRNSDVTILYNFLRTIYKELDMKKLTADHWKYIHEIITIQLFKKQQIYHPMFVEYIKFQYMENKPVENLIRTMLNEIPKTMLDFEYKDDKFQKFMLETYLRFLPEIKDEKHVLAIQIALSVIKWNIKHPKDTICLSNQQSVLEIVSNLKDTEKIEPNTLKIFKYLICRQDATAVKDSELDKIYWSNFKNLNNKTITTWFVKYKPVLLKEHLDKLGIILKDKNANLVNTLRKYDHLDIPSAVTALCLEDLDNCEVAKRARVVRILVLFMAREDLKNYFNKFIPTVDKLDVSSVDENAQKSYEIQCALGKYIKLAVNPKYFLSDLLKYCRGDVLGSALASLYSSFCRIPSNDLYPALDELSTKAVSVRKHTIFLSSLILPQHEVITKYKQIDTEKNATVKQYMFVSCYKYFVKNQQEECWPILQSYIPEIKKQQKDALKLLTKVNRIPVKYRAVFTELSWKTLDKFKKENAKLSDQMESLLGNIGKNDIKNLSADFCGEVIGKLFDLDECTMIDSVSSFVRKYLLYGGNLEDALIKIFKVLHDFKAKFWNTDDKKIEALKIVHKFCFHLLENMVDKDVERFDENFPKLFQTAWNAEFQMEETFEENLLIDFVIFRVESGIKTESLVEQIHGTYTKALEKYGTLIIGIFKNFLSSMLRLVLSSDNYSLELINFLDSFLENNACVENCILVIELLPTGYYLEEDAQDAYTKLVEKLSKMEQMVKICLFGKLKSVNY